MSKEEKEQWSHTVGERGYTVTVYEREPGGMIYLRIFDPKLQRGKGGYRRVSLAHRDRKKAKAYALDQAAKLRKGLAEIAEERATLARIFILYEAHQTPRKSKGEQQADKRRVEMWTRVLGGQKNPAFISRDEEWLPFLDRRKSGEIDARGMAVPVDDRKPVKDRVLQADCIWLRTVLNWAVNWRDRDGRRLLRENGTDGLAIPAEKNPKRPVATDDRYKAIRTVSDRVMMRVRWTGEPTVQRSYLSELLDIANGTARRISAICGLRYRDFRLEATDSAPYGSIVWPEDTDKLGVEWSCPISPAVRAAIDRILQERPGIGALLVFPSPEDASKPVDKDMAAGWLAAAEDMAGVAKLEQGAWHPYRRKWATERRHLPIPDVAAAGGWKSRETLLRCYQQPDEETMFSVVLGEAELRKKKA